MSQKFCNILVLCEAQFGISRCFCRSQWRWPTRLDCERLSSPDTHWMLLTGFEKVVKVTNDTGLWDAKLTWLSQISTHQICLYALAHGLGIHNFSSTCSYFFVEGLAFRANFSEPSGYCTVVNCALAFCTKNIFGCFCGVVAQFKLGNHKFLYSTIFRIHLSDFHIAQGVIKCTDYHNNS